PGRGRRHGDRRADRGCRQACGLRGHPRAGDRVSPVEAFRFVFMADCQLGCYASFSGMDEADVARFAARNMRVVPAPRTEGFAWDAERYHRAIAAAARLPPDFAP